MPEDEPIIRLEKVSKVFDGLVVLNDASLEIYPGKTTVVIGPSGCGKTVLLKHIIGLLKPDRGKVFFAAQEISGMSERQLMKVRRRMGFLFQGSALFDSMTVWQNVCFPLDEHGIGTDQERATRCGEVLAMVGLEGLTERYPEQLSGGQKKRVALARALVMGPEVILYDEPTTGLDPVRADLINDLILRLHSRLGTTSVVVTHDMNSTRKIADRIVMLHGGRFIADTTPQGLDAVEDPIVRRFVRGQAGEEDTEDLRPDPPSTAQPQTNTQSKG